MANPPLKYLVDTSNAIRKEEFSWLDSPYSKSVLCRIENQLESCICYGLTVSEATRAAINLKRGTDIPKLSTMEIVKNCRDNKCKGNTTPVAFEWIVDEGIAEDSVLPLEPSEASDLAKGKMEGAKRHFIDDWEPVPNCDAHMKSTVLRQPVVVSLMCPRSLHSVYKGGLIDPDVMARENSAYGHSMLLVGFGFYVYPNKSIKYYWQLKNSMGVKSGVKGYLYVLRNISQPLDKWVVFDPVVPICLMKGEIYNKEKNLVEDKSLDDLFEIELNGNLDIIILFCESEKVGEEANAQILKNFRRISRFYLPEKDDVKFVRVQLTQADVNTGMEKYGGVALEDLPLIKVYKHKKDPRKVHRSLSSGRSFMRSQMLEEGEVSFGLMAEFFFEQVGGISQIT